MQTKPPFRLKPMGKGGYHREKKKLERRMKKVVMGEKGLTEGEKWTADKGR